MLSSLTTCSTKADGDTAVLKKELTAETAFTALVLLQILRAPLETIGDSK